MATIPWTEPEIAEAKAKCSEALSSLTLNYEPLPPIKEGLCGAPASILLKSLGRDPEIALDPPATDLHGGQGAARFAKRVRSAPSDGLHKSRCYQTSCRPLNLPQSQWRCRPTLERTRTSQRA